MLLNYVLLCRSHARYQIKLTTKIRKITPSLVSSAQNRCLVRRWSNDDAKRSHLLIKKHIISPLLACGEGVGGGVLSLQPSTNILQHSLHPLQNILISKSHNPQPQTLQKFLTYRIFVLRIVVNLTISKPKSFLEALPSKHFSQSQGYHKTTFC